MRFAVSPAFDLNREEEKQLKEVVSEVFLNKPRGRSRGQTRSRATKRQKAITTLF
ncbi:hypothetical protein HOU08_gp215 [Dickeya phage vB_DsoM_JA29]|uniref:Uncharacterized protein n=1 Tax=Dickeya phage vB_DsoM_JA29 TaxID=2283031 RepID=A0A384ZXH6_9CAUD|nr:hypothetical protein HOU08_gp215 [Dickeya phage vB_DsoM_JA29]AXG66941.1 hypothetical protein JA29_215 [Dickeya phage vB_DsoM_JA29]